MEQRDERRKEEGGEPTHSMAIKEAIRKKK